MQARSTPLPMAGAANSPSAIGLIRAAVFMLALLPLARLFVLGFGGNLGANPVEFVTRSTGTWTLVMLCVTLSVTPLRWLGAPVVLVRLRRMLGLFAFFYGSLHFTTYLWLDQWFDINAMIADLAERPFILAGFSAWLMMLPLALSSNQWSMRRLNRRWKLLHRLIYLIAPVAVLHFWWHKAGKNDLGEPTIYALVVAALLCARLIHALIARRRRQRGTVRSSA